jgi:Fe-S-cluster containining protein
MVEKVKVEFELQMGEQGVRVSLAVPTAPMSARRMLPLFMGLTNQVVDVAVAAAAKRGETVSCKAGCGACCRSIVPISWTEARHVRALVDAMPEPRRSEVRARFADAVARLEAEGLLPEARAFDSLPDEQYLALHPRYFALHIPCPFLEDESCSIHAQRPLVCREFLVTSAPEHCSTAGSPEVRRVPLPTFPSVVVPMLEATDARDSRIALVLSLEWSEAHAGDTEALRPATEWIDKLLEGLATKPLPEAP